MGAVGVVGVSEIPNQLSQQFKVIHLEERHSCTSDGQESVSASDTGSVSREASLPAVPACPLCHQLMGDPVIVAETGHTYDRGCIEQWFEEHDTDPATGERLSSKVLAPNYILRDIIRQGLRQGERLVYPMATAPVERMTAPAPQALATQSGILGDYDTLLELLSSDVPDLQDEALRLLHAMLQEDGGKLQPLVEQGVILGLVAVLSSGSWQGQSMAVDVLALVLEQGPGNMAGLYLDAGVIQGLITMLLSPSPLCQTQAIGMLAQLSTRYAPAVRVCEEGGLALVVQMLGGDNVTCKEYASTALAAVCRHGEELVLMLARTEEAVRLLVPLLRSGNGVCQESATYVLGQVARLGPEQEAAICSYPLIDPLVQLLYFAQDDTQLYAAQLLVELCKNTVRNRGMVALAGGATPLLKMLVSAERAHQMAAGELLVYLEQVKESRKDVLATFKALDREMQKGIKKQVKELRLKLRL